MTFEQAYVDTMTAAQAALAAWPGPEVLVLETDNRSNVDLNDRPEPFISVELHFLDGLQLSIGQTKEMADIGQIHIIASSPQAAGSIVLHRILDHFRPYFEVKDSFVVLRTFAAFQGERFSERGRYCLPLVVPFRTHRLVTS